MDLQKVKLIQVHKDAKPPRQDGYGFELYYCGFIPAKKQDGTDVALLYTGWEFGIPEGYIGQIYDTDYVKGMSILRMQQTMFLTNNFPYRTDDQFKNIGFHVVYQIIGGISSSILDKENPMIGVSIFKIPKSQILEMETEVKIHEPQPPKEGEVKAPIVS